MLIGGFCMRKRAAVSEVATADPIEPRKPLEISYLGIAVRVRVASWWLGKKSNLNSGCGLVLVLVMLLNGNSMILPLIPITSLS